MSDTKPAFVFVHGGWVGGGIWQPVIRLLEERDYVGRALDLPGCGVHAKSPQAYSRRPLNAEAFATEPSPVADVTQEERTAAVVAFVEDTARKTGGPVVLVAQSLGG